MPLPYKWPVPLEDWASIQSFPLVAHVSLKMHGPLSLILVSQERGSLQIEGGNYEDWHPFIGDISHVLRLRVSRS